MSQAKGEILGRISFIEGDITREEVDAIVNAANGSLQGGGGVDGAIHRAAGPELLASCESLRPRGCPTGEARITPGFRLPARFVIHGVGPVWRGGQKGEPELLGSAYRESIRLAVEAGCRSIAFPAISCGVYGYPHREAARIALASVAEAALDHPGLEQIRFILFSRTMLELFAEIRRELVEEAKSGGEPGR